MWYILHTWDESKSSGRMFIFHKLCLENIICVCSFPIELEGNSYEAGVMLIS